MPPCNFEGLQRVFLLKSLGWYVALNIPQKIQRLRPYIKNYLCGCAYDVAAIIQSSAGKIFVKIT